MTKDVLIRICGMQWMDEGEPEKMELVMPGKYYFKNGKHTIVYEELMDDFSGSVRNMIRFSPELMDVHKTGLVETRMIFEPGKKELTHYATPMGEFMIEVATKSLELEESEERLRVVAGYELDMNYDPVSSCEISVEVCAMPGQA
ncbi:MAG: DUF1934 domain-containing protein [Clostridiales bacterium]|nr:DUF1934 domain-containing protein [Clostridiales bacterium]